MLPLTKLNGCVSCVRMCESTQKCFFFLKKSQKLWLVNDQTRTVTTVDAGIEQWCLFLPLGGMKKKKRTTPASSSSMRLNRNWFDQLNHHLISAYSIFMLFVIVLRLHFFFSWTSNSNLFFSFSIQSSASFVDFVVFFVFFCRLSICPHFLVRCERKTRRPVKMTLVAFSFFHLFFLFSTDFSAFCFIWCFSLLPKC